MAKKETKKIRRVRRAANDGMSAPGPALTKEEQFRQEYSYVISDLRRVFVIAGAMFILLIAANLLLS